MEGHRHCDECSPSITSFSAHSYPMGKVLILASCYVMLCVSQELQRNVEQEDPGFYPLPPGR